MARQTEIHSTNGKVTGIGEPTNDGAAQIEYTEPYRVAFAIEGHADFLFHRWSVDGVEEKARAAKGSKAKKTDDIESYVWRNEKGELCVPGEYCRQSIIMAAKYHADPRSPRKSAMDLFKAGVVSLTELAGLGTSEWNYVDRRRVQVQRNGITRHRPAMNAGWRVEFVFMVTTPEYIQPHFLQQVTTKAGLLVGVGDNRPTFGRYGLVNFKVLPLQ
jgi:hypothetical protein